MTSPAAHRTQDQRAVAGLGQDTAPDERDDAIDFGATGTVYAGVTSCTIGVTCEVTVDLANGESATVVAEAGDNTLDLTFVDAAGVDAQYSGGTVPTFSATSGDVDVFTFIRVAGVLYGFAAGQAMAVS